MHPWLHWIPLQFCIWLLCVFKSDEISLLMTPEQLSFTGFLATYLQNLSIQMAKVGRVTLYLYVQVCSLYSEGEVPRADVRRLKLPVIAFMAYAVFDDPMTPMSLLGATIIIGSSVFLTLKKEQQKDTRGLSSDSEASYVVVNQEEGDVEIPLSTVSQEKQSV